MSTEQTNTNTPPKQDPNQSVKVKPADKSTEPARDDKNSAKTTAEPMKEAPAR